MGSSSLLPGLSANDVELFEVALTKGPTGLGITSGGYVIDDPAHGGILAAYDVSFGIKPVQLCSPHVQPTNWNNRMLFISLLYCESIYVFSHRSYLAYLTNRFKWFLIFQSIESFLLLYSLFEPTPFSMSTYILVLYLTID